MNMMNKTDAVEDMIILSGIGISLVDIQTIMSIVLLTFNILWLILKFTLKLFRYLRDGKLTDDELNDLADDVEEINKVGGDKNE